MNQADPKNFFIRALEYIIDVSERGFVNNPADKGGPTKYGITKKDLEKIKGRPVTDAEVEALDKDDTMEFYRKEYWEQLSCDKLTQYEVALSLFDSCILFGIRPVSLYSQMALVVCGFSELQIDGKIGPLSIECFNLVDPQKFCLAYVKLLNQKIDHILNASPSQKVFEHGWRSRINRYIGEDFGNHSS